jgi:hypothetical protein
VGDFESTGCPRCIEVPAESGGHADELVGGVLEGDVEAAFAIGEPFSDVAQGEDRLARPGRAQDEGGVTFG